MKKKSSNALSVTIKIAILGTVAAVVMLLEFPLVFIAPSFYELDFSEVIVLLGGFALGPVPAMAIEAVKIAVNLLIGGSHTVGVGELANFLIGCSFVVPASIIYKYNKTKKGAVIGMLVSTISMVAVGCVLNAFVLLPFYSKAYGMPIDAFIQMGTAINSHVNNIFTFVLITVAPFNLIKCILTSIIILPVYKRVSPILKK